MMKMMSGFVERIISSPQTCCQSSKQVGLQMVSKRRGERVVVRRVAGKLFQITGSATSKLLTPSVVVVLGMDSNPVRADRMCLLPAIAEIARQSSATHVGANPCWVVMCWL